VLWASNFYSYKRAPLAIAAYARLEPELRRRFPFVLAGGDWAGGRAEAEAAARRAGVSGDVFFAGWIGDASLPAAFRGARVHVLPTAEETFGRSILDAMACGCPCLVQDLPVLREVAAEAADFVDFSDTGAASAALARLCRSDSHAAARRAAGLVRAQDFSFAKLARERVSAILEIVAARGGAG
jgi:alpha-1,3-rhamnosyl/mannosyltransferase